MKQLLVTTDFSPEAARALAPAIDLARRLGLGLTLLHVVVDLRTAPQGAALAPPQSDPMLSQDVAAARESLTSLATELQTGADGPAVTTEVITTESTVAKAIADYAFQHDVAMIAMSTHGRTGWRHWILGSVAEEVCRQAPVPVVTYPREPDGASNS